MSSRNYVAWNVPRINVQNNEVALLHELQKSGKNPDIIATAKKIAAEKIWMGLV